MNGGWLMACGVVVLGGELRDLRVEGTGKPASSGKEPSARCEPRGPFLPPQW